MTQSTDSAKGTTTPEKKRETKSGELRELRQNREKKKELSRDRRTNSRFGTSNVEDISRCPSEKNFV